MTPLRSVLGKRDRSPEEPSGRPRNAQPDPLRDERETLRSGGRPRVTPLEELDSPDIGPSSLLIPIARATDSRSSSTIDSHRVNTTTISTNNSRIYEHSKHNEFQHVKFDGPVGLGGNTTIHYTQTQGALEKFAEAHCADGAAFNSRRLEHEPTCLNDTRVDLLNDIMRWSDNPDDACIFWLNGMAGTGKSTIARTVAHKWDLERRLGASFFFTKGRGDLANASKFLSTLAYQLARARSHDVSGLAAHISKAICDNPDILKQNLKEQWKNLISQPLSQLNDVPPQSLLLVVDALDECAGEKDTELLLQLLSQAKALGPVRLRVFVTSRPPIAIRFRLSGIESTAYREIILHENPESVNPDISTFLRHEFDTIRMNCDLPEGWPDKPSLDNLVRKAGGLFIYAATVCRFIGDIDEDPEERLTSVLSDETMEHGSSTQQLNSMYTTLLISAVVEGREPEKKPELLRRFKRIIGSIVILFDALTADALAGLLSAKLWKVKQTLRSLGSVLQYGSESDSVPITLLHLSFRDFLLNNQRCTDQQFHIASGDAHAHLAASCLDLMSRRLKQDICSLKLPGSLTIEVDRSAVNHFLPQEVQYACRFWFDHLQQSNVELRDGDSKSLHKLVHNFLNENFLHWLEALSLMGNISNGILIVRTLASMLPSDADYHLRAMASDAVRFVLTFGSIIAIAPLQVYCSALTLSPKKSTLKEHYSNCVPAWITQQPMVPNVWDPTALQVLCGHSDGVGAVAFSPDGRLIASGSHDKTVRLWDPVTGTCCGTLEGHSGSVTAVAFSPDGRLIASGSLDKTVRLWDPVTGTCCGTLEGHSDWVNAVAFSPDGTVLQLISYDGTVQLRDVDTHDVIQAVNAGGNPYTMALFYVSNGWIFLGARRIFLLPPNYQTRCFAVRNNTIALGGVSGIVSFLKFDSASVPIG